MEVLTQNRVQKKGRVFIKQAVANRCLNHEKGAGPGWGN